MAFLCVFRFGNKVLPGLFFAQFIFNFRGISAVTGIHLNSILAPIFPSVGTVLQAYACVWVFRKIIIYRQEDIIKVLLVVPFIGCLVSSSLAHIGFWVLNIPIPNLLRSWITWYLGDSFGCLVFAPMAPLMQLSPNPVKNWLKVIPTFLALMGTLSVFVLVKNVHFSRQELLWREQAHSSQIALETRLNQAMGTLKALRAFFNPAILFHPTSLRNFAKPISAMMTPYKRFN